MQLNTVLLKLQNLEFPNFFYFLCMCDVMKADRAPLCLIPVDIVWDEQHNLFLKLSKKPLFIKVICFSAVPTVTVYCQDQNPQAFQY